MNLCEETTYGHDFERIGYRHCNLFALFFDAKSLSFNGVKENGGGHYKITASGRVLVIR